MRRQIKEFGQARPPLRFFHIFLTPCFSNLLGAEDGYRGSSLDQSPAQTSEWSTTGSFRFTRAPKKMGYAVPYRPFALPAQSGSGSRLAFARDPRYREVR